MSAPIVQSPPASLRTAAWWQGRLALTAAIAAGLLYAFVPTTEDEAPLVPDPDRLGVFARHDGIVKPLAADAVIGRGDELLFSTWAADARYVAVILADASRRTTVAFPADGGSALHGAGRGVPLPIAPVAPPGPGPVTAHAFFCEEPLVLAGLKASIEAGAEAAPAGCTVDRLAFVVAD